MLEMLKAFFLIPWSFARFRAPSWYWFLSSVRARAIFWHASFPSKCRYLSIF